MIILIRIVSIYIIIGSIIAFICCVGGFIENIEDFISSEKEVPKWANIYTALLLLVILWPAVIYAVITNSK